MLTTPERAHYTCYTLVDKRNNMGLLQVFLMVISIIPFVDSVATTQEATTIGPVAFTFCPYSVSVSITSNRATKEANWEEPEAENAVEIESNHQSGDDFPIGNTEVVYTAVGVDELSVECIFIVTVSDDEPPHFIDCNITIAVVLAENEHTKAVTWTPPTAIDNSNLNVHLTTESVRVPGDVFQYGSTKVTYYATDNACNEGSCDITIVLSWQNVFGTPNFHNCPDNIEVNFEDSSTTIAVSWTPPSCTADWTFDAPDVTSNFDPGDSFSLGIIMVEYIASVQNLFSSTTWNLCAFTVRVLDRYPPELIEKVDPDPVPTIEGLPTAMVNWQVPVFEDQRAFTVSTSYPSPTGEFQIGTTNVRYTASDGDCNTGNTETDIVITVYDWEDPIISSCPENKTREAAVGRDGKSVNWDTPDIFDNSGSYSVSWSANPWSFFYIGLTEVKLTASDNSGNEDECYFYIKIYDYEPPTMVCPTVTVSTSAGESWGIAPFDELSITDNSNQPVDIESSHDSGDVFQLGSTSVYFNGTDPSGNFASCTFEVNVIDTEAPELSGCPSNIEEVADPGERTHTVSWTPPSATDNTDPNPVVVLASDMDFGSAFVIGNNQVRYTATDTYDNEGVCTFVVTIYDDQPPIVSNCPVNITLPTDHLMPTAVTTWGNADLFDNSLGNIYTVWNIPKGSAFAIGSTRVFLTASDESGNEATCDFYINVYDNEAPVLTCPHLTEPNDFRLPSAVVWPNPHVTDNSGLAVSLTASIPSGSVFLPGSTVVHYNGTDTFDNVGNCSFVVTVEDTESPFFTYCPDDISNSSDPGERTHSVVWQVPTAEDNSGNQPHVVSNFNPGDYFSIGVTTVVYKATDDDRNPNETCSFLIEIIDYELPVISNCPDNISLPTDHRMPTRETTWNDVMLFDNSLGVITSWWNIVNGSEFVIGSTRVFLTARDESGNDEICEFHIHIYDVEPPVLTCSDLTVPNDFRLPSAVVEWFDPGAIDNNGLAVSLVPSIPSNSTFLIGTTVVYYNGTDTFDNIGTCSFVVTVEDVESPFFTYCPDDISNGSDPGERTHSVVWQVPVAEDNSGNQPHVVSNFNPGDYFSLGVTTVVYKATDDDRNPNETCSFIIEIIDYEPPVISNCPDNISLPTDHRMPTRETTWNDVVLFDNSIGVITSWWNIVNGSVFVIGSTRVFLTARDESGNDGICEFYIHIYDDEPPVLTCSDLTVPNDYRLPSAVVEWSDPGAIDNNGLAVSLVPSIPSNSTFLIGTTVVYYNGTDTFGNIGTCSFVVTVEDVESPFFTYCPDDISNSSDPGERTHSVVWRVPIAEDNSGNQPHMVSNFNPGDYFSLGITTVVYKATDDDRNPNDTCVFHIEIIDYEPPIIFDCPDNISLPTDHRMPTRETTWNDVMLFDNSLGVITSWWNIVNGSKFVIGSTRVFLTARDESGNDGICEFYIHIYDAEVPQFTYCPPNIYLSALEGDFDAEAVWNVSTAIDNSGILPTIKCTNQSSDRFPIGVSDVTYTATDAFSNANTCIFKIYVFDDESPHFITCPADIIVSNEFRRDGSIVDWTEPIVFDNSLTDLIVTSSPRSGDYFTLGRTLVEYIAIDDHNNTAFCYFNVTVNDTEQPTFQNCPTNFTHSTDPQLPSAMVFWVPPTSEDNSGEEPNVTSNHNPEDIFLIGTNEIIYWSVDLTGNQEICSFFLLVFDDETPEFTFCPSNILLNPMYFRPSAIANWSQPTAEDNSNTVEYLVPNYDSGDVFPIGQTTVIYRAIDAANNSKICSFSVTVTDIAPPIWYNCLENFVVTTDFRRPDANVSWIVPTAVDDSGYDPAIVSNHNPGDILHLGEIGIIYTATDRFQNTAVCTFSITVIDIESPVFVNCPRSFVFFIDDATDIGFPSWVVPNVTDNSGATPNVSASHQPLDAFPINTTFLNYTATDGDNNIATCQFSITVLQAFNYLQNLNFEKASSEDIQEMVDVSVTAVTNLEGRRLNQNEEEILFSTLDVLQQDNTAQRDEEISKNQVIGAVKISEALIQPNQKPTLETQLDVVASVERIFFDRIPELSNNNTFTYASINIALNMHPLKSRSDPWFHFYKESGKLASKSTESNSFESEASVRLKSNGLGDEGSVNLLVSYFERSVFESSSSKEKVDYIQLESGDQITYKLQSGLLACKLMKNYTSYSTAIDFVMVVEVEEYMIELIREAVCVFWNEESKQWNRDGCQLVTTDASGKVECFCTHTTIFGILLPTELKDDNIDLYSIMLRVVTYSTGLLSIVSLIAVAYIMFLKQKQQNPFDVERTSVMKNLIVVSLLMTCSYMSTLELGEITLACIIAGVVLEYLYIAMVMWIFIDVFNVFTKLHNFKSEHWVYYHLAIGWGFSAFVAFLFFGTYRGHDDSDGCWTNMEVGVIAAFATPTFLILLASIIMLLICLTCKTKLKGKRREIYIIQTKCISRGICVLLPLFLATWTLSVQVSQGSAYRMLFFGMFALHGALIAGYCYFNFRYLRKARTPVSEHMVDENYDHAEEINTDVKTDEENITKPIDTVGEFDEIDEAIENQISIRSSSSLRQSQASQSEVRPNCSTASLKKIDRSPSAADDLHEDGSVPLPGAITDTDINTDRGDVSNINKIDQPKSDSSDEESENEETQRNENDLKDSDDDSESSDEDEKSEKDASSGSSDSDSSDDDNVDDDNDDNDVDKDK